MSGQDLATFGDVADMSPTCGAKPATDKDAIFNLVWTYVVKELDKRKKARCTCDGSTRGGQVCVLDYTYANCVDQTSSHKKMSCRLECLNDTTFDDMSGISQHVGNFLIVV